MDYYELGADVLEGVVSDERTFYYMAELDSEEEIDNPETGKANPNLGSPMTLKAEKCGEKKKHSRWNDQI
ncbi:hypothetical protein P7H25_08795 [Paenibacillus larvae]|nr:hypothetical protein [Paenibacillus larvae]MDT2255714.1 hypothetical protein [Paenibacillus larvae]